MDGQRFDDLVRSLTERPSRRSLLGGLTGGLLGGVLNRFGLDDAEAAKKKKKPKKGKKGKKKKGPKKCPPGRKRCGKVCCGKGKVCRNRKCRNKAPNTPGCTPLTKEAACGTRVCGPVSNNCSGTHDCGSCTGPAQCGDSGQCDCTPDQTREEACQGRNCGTVTNSCGGEYTCGPNGGTCPGPNQQCLNNVCTCVPQTRAEACAGRECGTVPTGCGDDVYTCGPGDGTCPGGGTCQNGQCPATCTGCEDGCCDGEICRTDFQINSSACGHSGGVCRNCGPGVACVNGVCTCTGNSCDGCCRTNDAGQPYCDTTMQRCGDRCIARAACCHQRDSSIFSSTTPGCWGPEICSGVNQQGYGTCRCGSFVCNKNDGCCSLNENHQPFCDPTKRRCGDVCILKTECCQFGGEPGCNEGITCAPETCEPQTGTGQNPPPGYCKRGTVSGVCSGACAAGYGYGNYFPEFQREVVCGRGSVHGETCQCWRTMDGTSEGSNVCAETVPAGLDSTPCRSNNDCGNNEVCIRSGMSGIQHTCAPICQ